MENIRWHPIRQEYVTPQNNQEPRVTRIDADRHQEALFGALIPGGLLLKVVSPGGTHLTFVPGDHKALAPSLAAGPEKGTPSLSHFEEKLYETTVDSALTMFKR